MTRTLLAIAPAVMLIAGCAVLPVRGGAGAGAADPAVVWPADRLERATKALELGLYGIAFADLSDIYSSDPTSAEGQIALLLLIASELDPRNPVRRTDVGARLAGEGMLHLQRGHWLDPVLATLYLLALESGALEPDLPDVRANNAAAEQPLLPHLPTAPWPDRLGELEVREAELSERVAELEEEVGALRSELTEKSRELERIRRTLRP